MCITPLDFVLFSGRWGYLWVNVFLGGIPLALSVPETSLPPQTQDERKQTNKTKPPFCARHPVSFDRNISVSFFFIYSPSPLAHCKVNDC